jgi:hypothetical protein
MNYVIMGVGIIVASLLKATGYDKLGPIDVDIIVAFAAGAGWGVLTTRKVWLSEVKKHIG